MIAKVNKKYKCKYCAIFLPLCIMGGVTDQNCPSRQQLNSMTAKRFLLFVGNLLKQIVYCVHV